MKLISNPVLRRVIFALFACSGLFISSAVWAGDSAEAFMSATFGLSSARTQKRMENSGAVASDFIRGGQLSMKGTFEYRPAVFNFGFHNKRGLNHKALYLASSGDAASDKALYDALREAYSIRFGKTNERPIQHTRVKGRIMLQNSWKPDQYTTIQLSYDPEVTNRLPGNSLLDRPIHLIYTYTKWTK